MCHTLIKGAIKMKNKKCEWLEVEKSDHVIYETACGNKFISGNYEKLYGEFKYCVYCGREISTVSARTISEGTEIKNKYARNLVKSLYDTVSIRYKVGKDRLIAKENEGNLSFYELLDKDKEKAIQYLTTFPISGDKQQVEKEKEKLAFLEKYAKLIIRKKIEDIPPYFVLQKKEMFGKYGWFEPSSGDKPLNLPEYCTGWVFEDESSYKQYLQLLEQKDF